jgi:hypothetical protein
VILAAGIDVFRPSIFGTFELGVFVLARSLEWSCESIPVDCSTRGRDQIFQLVSRLKQRNAWGMEKIYAPEKLTNPYKTFFSAQRNLIALRAHPQESAR